LESFPSHLQLSAAEQKPSPVGKNTNIMADESWRVPTPVQELAATATLEEPPSQYVLQEKDRPGSPLVADDMPEPLPIINLSRLSEDATEAAKLESALQSWGLVLVSE
jgi:hypothetical protein